MKALLLLLSTLLLGCTSMTKQISLSGTTPPVAKKEPLAMPLHGSTRIDNYYWLRDDKREAPQVIAHLEAENQYTQSQMADYGPLQSELFSELTSRLEKDDSSVPYLWQQHWYWSRYSQDLEYPQLYRSNENERANSENAQLLLDINERAAGHEFYGFGGVAISMNEALLAFTEDTLGRRIYQARVKNLASGHLLDDVLEGLDSQPVWANDNQHLFYIAKDPQTLLGDRVYRHALGTLQSEDVLVYQERDESFYLSLGKTLDGTHILLTQESTTTSEVSLLDAANPIGKFVSILPREEGHEYSVTKLGSELYILTNWQALNFRLMKAEFTRVSNKENWRPVIRHDANVRIEDVLLLKDYLVIQSRSEGLTHISVSPFDERPAFTLDFDDPAYVVGIDVNAQQSTQVLRVYYASMTTPETIYEYDLLHPGQKQLLKQQKVLGDFDSQHYKTERIMVAARDDVRVPVSLVYRKDAFSQDGSNPLYVYGYGAYGYTVEADFSSSIISLLDRGFVYAIAHIRGGEMLGREWYDSGRMLNKQHTFDDFVDVTRALVTQGYGDKGRVVAAGGSAGGLLMGAVVNQAPELYYAVAAHVPFVDIVTTMLDETIPLTTNEYDEWGNPNEQKYFDYMLSYSPYDQIRAQDYPHMLVTTGLHDSQVQYFEPAKWVAKLREYKTDDNKLLLHVDMEAGHGGKSGRYRQYEDIAREYAFFLGLIGID